MPSTSVSRRRVLAACTPVAGGFLGGCSDGLRSGEASSGSTLHLRLHAIGRSLVERHVTDLAETDVEWDEDAFQAALDGSDYTLQYRRPFPVRNRDEPAYTLHEGTYYELDSVIVGEARVSRPILRLYGVGRQDGSDDLPAFTPHDELPPVDQRAVQIAHLATRARGNEGGMPVGLVERGGYAYRSEERANRSRLLTDSGPAHVGYRDAVYRVERSNETFFEPIYRPDIDPVAESEAEMEAVLRAAFVESRIDPDSLTQEERRIVRRARGNGYDESHPFSDPYVSLLEALDRRAFIDGNVEKDAGVERDRSPVLEYGAEYYEYFLRLES